MALRIRRPQAAANPQAAVMNAIELGFGVLDAAIAHANDIHMSQGFAAEMGRDIAAQAAQVEALGLAEVLEEFADAVHLLARHTADDCLTIDDPHSPELTALLDEASDALQAARPLAPAIALPLIDGLSADISDMPRVLAGFSQRFLALEEAFDDLSKQALRLSNALAEAEEEEDDGVVTEAELDAALSAGQATAPAEDDEDGIEILVLSPEEVALMNRLPGPVADALQDLFRVNARLVNDAGPFRDGLERLQDLDTRLAERHLAAQTLQDHFAQTAAEAEAAAAESAAVLAAQNAAMQERERLSVETSRARRRGSRTPAPVSGPL